MKYSQHDLLGEEMLYLEYPPSNLIEKFQLGFIRVMSKEVDFTLHLPTYYVLNLSIFCEEMTELSEKKFPLKQLVRILFDGFLYHVKTTAHPHDIYRRLMSHDNDTLVKSYQGNSYKIERSETMIKVPVIRKSALRCEVFLNDLGYHVKHTFTVEKVLEILICDFMKEYLYGDREKAMNNLVENIS